MTHTFKHLYLTQEIVLKLIQILNEVECVDIAIRKIGAFVSNWNSINHNNVIDWKHAESLKMVFTKYGNTCTFTFNLYDLNKENYTIKVLVRDTPKYYFNILIIDINYLILARFDSKNLNKYVYSLPTLEHEVAFDFYATYIDWWCNIQKGQTDVLNLEKLSKYPKYIEKCYPNSDKLKGILHHYNNDAISDFKNYLITNLTLK